MDAPLIISQVKERLPRRVYFLMANEVAERFSFYGMTAILPTYLRDQFFSGVETDANAVLHLFRGSVYFFPLLGALLADGLIGRYLTIRNLSVLYVMGHLLLALFPENYLGFCSGLFVIALASGGIKPNVSAFIGGQVEGQGEAVRQRAFNILYFCINIGGTLSQIFVPVIRERWGIAWAFLVPGIAMLLALLVFLMPSKQYVRQAPMGLGAVKKLFTWSSLKSILMASRVFLFIVIFMALYEENAGAWIFQAQSLDLHFLGMTLEAEQVQSANGIFVLILVPLFSLAIFPLLARRGIQVSLEKRIGIGFLLVLAAYAVIIALQHAIEGGVHPPVAWQVFAYFLLTTAEVMVNVSCLQLAFDNASAETKSIVTAIYFFSITIGNLVGSVLSSVLGGTEIGVNYYWILLVLMIVNTIGYYFYASKNGKKP